MKKIILITCLLLAAMTTFADGGTITNDTFWKTKAGAYIFSQGGGIFRFPDSSQYNKRYF